MDAALPDPARDWDAAWGKCEELLLEARDNGAVMSILWHPRYFSTDHPGFTRLYRRLVERAQELGAWVGPVGELYASLNHFEQQRRTSKVRES
jgi:peptidoglycan/xylan/chitin deacetylase (PgdA/CDA1 family)